MYQLQISYFFRIRLGEIKYKQQLSLGTIAILISYPKVFQIHQTLSKAVMFAEGQIIEPKLAQIGF
jgi:hypothetical protein